MSQAGAGAAGGDMRTLGAGPGESGGWPDFGDSPGSAGRAVWAGTDGSENTTQTSLPLTGNVENKTMLTVNKQFPFMKCNVQLMVFWVRRGFWLLISNYSNNRT